MLRVPDECNHRTNSSIALIMLLTCEGVLRVDRPHLNMVGHVWLHILHMAGLSDSYFLPTSYGNFYL